MIANSKYLLFFFFSLLLTGIQAQDLHFSQHYLVFQNINPALTGMMKPDYRFATTYRSQWQSVPVPYLTFVGAFDMKYYLPGDEEGFFGGGLIFNYDQAGDAQWRLAQLGLSISYSRALNESNIITAGFQWSGGQRSLDISKLQFANQYDGEAFDRDLPTRENDLSENGYSYTDFAAGFNWNFVSENGLGESTGNLGFGIFHLNRPTQGIYTTSTSRLPFRFTLYSQGRLTFEDIDKMDFFISAQGQRMGAANEVIAGGDARYFLTQKNAKRVAVALGLHYRFVGVNDALVPSIKLYYQDWTFGFSYDVNMSEFSVATQRRGGPEINVLYTVTKVKPLKEFRACPLF